MDLETLYRSEFGWVYHTARRLGVHARDLEDAVHDIFVKVSGKLASYDDARPAKPWLYAFIHGYVSDYRRRAATRRTDLDPAPEVISEGVASAEDQMETARQRRLLDQALPTIPAHRRDVVVMHDLDGLSIGEVARVLGITQDAVSSRLREGRENLRQALKLDPKRRGQS